MYCPNCGTEIKVEVPNNKNNKKIILIITGILLMLAAALFVLGYFFGNSNKKAESNTGAASNTSKENITTTSNQSKLKTFELFDTSKIEKQQGDNETLTKNIEIHDVFIFPYPQTYKKEVYVYGKNNNSTMVEVNVNIEYYDKEWYRLEKSVGKEKILPGKEFAISVYIEDDSLKYNSIKLIYTAKELASYFEAVSEIEYSDAILSDKSITIIAKNNSKDKEAKVTFTCIYYKNSKVVYARDATVSDKIKPEASGEAKCYHSSLNIDTNDDYSKRKYLDFDDYKVELSSSYYYEQNY